MPNIYGIKKDYNQILDDYKKELIAGMGRSKNKDKAEEIEKILREIKRFNLQLKENSVVEKTLNDQYRLLLQEANEMMRFERGNRGLKSTSLFFRKHNDFKVDNKTADDIFEQELSALIAAAVKMASEEQVSVKTFLVGRDNTTSKALEQVLKNEYYKTILKVQNNVAEILKDEYEGKELKVTQGKTDVKGMRQDFTISKEIPSKVEEFISLVKGHTFSLKNYNTFKEIGTSGEVLYKDLNEMKLSFGNTTLFKSITGVLDELGENTDNEIAFFFRGGNHVQGIGPRYSKRVYPEETQSAWAQMRLIYEIRGSGLLDMSGNSAIADFIIWNDPQTENIVVRATDDLIYNLLNSKSQRKGLFGDVRLTARQLLTN